MGVQSGLGRAQADKSGAALRLGTASGPGALAVSRRPLPNTHVILALLPNRTSLQDLAGVRGLSLGLLNAGLGGVPAVQTYLDITQGNRVFDSLYSSGIPRLGIGRNRVLAWEGLVNRAHSAPAEIVPGLLGSVLERAGVVVAAPAGHGDAAILAADRAGRIERCRLPVAAEGTCTAPRRSHLGPQFSAQAPGQIPDRGPTRTLAVRSTNLAQLRFLVARLRANDLLIAIERPPPITDSALAIGIAGRGFDGDLISDSTRMNGYVLSTDIAPTILQRFGIALPSQISGQAIRSTGATDAAAVASLGARLRVIPQRRGPVIGLSLFLWILALALAILASRGRAARPGVKLLALCVIYLPLVLLGGAALEATQLAEQLLVIIATPALAALTLAVLPQFRALAAASALTVSAYVVDMVAGSPLTRLSLLGPNPGLGVRFYGIGNELESLLVVLIVAGTGAGLAGFGPRLTTRGCAIAFLAVGLPLAAVFAVGQFGADVGAAIDFPAGAAVAAAVVSGRRRRRTALLVIAAPFAAVALLALTDLISGANAHLTRSVLDAGGFNQLADVAQLRLELSARSFIRPIVFVFMPLVAAFVAFVLVRRDRLGLWLRDLPTMKAGLIGALTASVVGTLANDSGALFLEIGAAYLLVFIGYIWAESPRPGDHRSINYP